MDSSTYYKLNLVTGSDNVNPLTIDRPNYEKIDTQMHNNEIAAISQASELKSGTVHAITCLTEDAVFIKFTSGSDYRSGDTFTYNGEIIRAVSPDGSSLKDYAFRVNSFVLAAVSGGQLTIYSSGAPTPAEIGAATAADAFANYTCVTNSRNHALTGTGNNIKFTADARYSSGNTITVNGGPVSAQLMDGSALPDGLWASGAIVSCFLNEGVLTFKSGGGVDVSSATASADKVLAPYTFFAGTSTKKTGTMADYAAKTAGGSVSTDGTNVVASPSNSGYYTAASKITIPYSSAANAFGITADKIVKDNTILGVTGTGGFDDAYPYGAVGVYIRSGEGGVLADTVDEGNMGLYQPIKYDSYSGQYVYFTPQKAGTLHIRWLGAAAAANFRINQGDSQLQNFSLTDLVGEASQTVQANTQYGIYLNSTSACRYMFLWIE